MTSKKRKIIQISSFFCEGWGPATTALCDDGTIWQYGSKKGSTESWIKFPDIPQPKDKL